MEIRKAKRSARFLKIGIGGITGSGKTFGALRMARGMTSDWSKICLIDTENKSGDLYADLGEYSVLTMEETTSPEDYIKAIDIVIGSNAFDVAIIDSLSHEWFGTGGALEMADKISSTSKSGSSFNAWGKVTPVHNAFVNCWLKAPIHIIGTMRQKDEYVIEQNEKGKAAPRKIGTKNIQREGVDYEFDLLATIHSNHFCTVEKDRTRIFKKDIPFELNEQLGRKLLEWSRVNEELPPPPPIAVYDGNNQDQKRILFELMQSFGVKDAQQMKTLAEQCLGTEMSRLSERINKLLKGEQACIKA